MSTSTNTPLSTRVLNMEESSTIKMSQMARDLASKGHEVISLSLGEPDFDTPEHIKEAAKAALDAGFTKYTPVPGLPELRSAIVEKFKRDNGLDFNVNQIVVSNGAKQSIANVCLALLNKGDEVVIFTPFWVSYFEIVRLAGGVPVLVKAGIEDDFKPKPAQLDAAITPKTKLVIFSSPCNPTGTVFTHDDLAGYADVLSKHDHVHVMADEIYEYINFTGKHVSIGQFEAIKDRVITVNGFAKGYAMTGWRLGYFGGPEWLAAACAKIQGQFTSGANSFSQKAAITALLGDMTPTNTMREAFAKRRTLIIKRLQAMDKVTVNNPMGAFYIFPDVSAYFGTSANGTAVHTADDLAEYLLDDAHVATVSGSGFGDDNCIRISYAASEATINEAMDRIEASLAKLS